MLPDGRPARSFAQDPQNDINGYFQASANYWNDIYFEQRLWPAIYRERQQIALKWIDALHLPSSSRILEIGCGAGFLSLALAQKGFSIDAMDSTPAMLALTGAHASEAGVTNQVSRFLADAHELPALSESYDLVIALGVIPWLHSERRALGEMYRILKQDAHLLLTADNDARLNRLLDPASCPLMKPLRSAAKWALCRATSQENVREGFQPKRHYPKQIDAILAAVRLKKVKATTIGFGVLTFAGKQVLSNRLSMRVHHRLQNLAYSNVFPFNKTGLHYMVLSRKAR